MEQPRPLFVAITGGTASGKSTLVVRQDAYFRDWPPGEEARRTRNAPEAVLWGLLEADLERLAAGLAVGPPPRPGPGEDGPRSAGRVVLCEGHLLLWEPSVRARFDLKIFLDAPDEERVLRRLLRDAARGGAIEGAAAWYRRDVLPNHRRYTAPARWWADLVVPAAPVSDAGIAALGAATEAAARPEGPGRTCV